MFSTAIERSSLPEPSKMSNYSPVLLVIVFPLTFLLYYGSFKYLRDSQTNQARDAHYRRNIADQNKISARFSRIFRLYMKICLKPCEDDLSFIKKELIKIKEAQISHPKQVKENQLNPIGDEQTGMFSSPL